MARRAMIFYPGAGFKIFNIETGFPITGMFLYTNAAMINLTNNECAAEKN